MITDHAKADTSKNFCASAYKTRCDVRAAPRNDDPRFMRRAIGAAAGGALGFIFNNLPGARIGARLGSMAAKRKRVSSNTYKGSKRARLAALAPALKRKGNSWTVKKTVRATPYIRKRAVRGRQRRRRSGKRGGAFAKTSASYFSLGRGPRLFPGFKRTQLPTTFTSTFTARLNGFLGYQAASLLPTYSIAAGANTEDSLYSSNWTIDWGLLTRAEEWLAQNENAPDATAYNSTAGAANRSGARWTQKYVVNYLKYDHAIRNMSNQDQSMTLYDCVLRPGVMPSQGASMDPLADWNNALKNEYNPSRQTLTDGIAGWSKMGTTPFMATGFCRLYKVKKVTKRTLAAGETHHHIVTVKPRNLFDGQAVGAQNSSGLVARGQFIPGLTGFTMVVFSGNIINQQATPTLITTNAGALDVLTTCNASFAKFTRERRFHMQFDGLTHDTAPIYSTVLDETDAINVPPGNA